MNMETHIELEELSREDSFVAPDSTSLTVPIDILPEIGKTETEHNEHCHSGLAPFSTNSKTHVAVFCSLGAILVAFVWSRFSQNLWWLGIPIGGVIGYGINWVRADLAWDKYE